MVYNVVEHLDWNFNILQRFSISKICLMMGSREKQSHAEVFIFIQYGFLRKQFEV